MTGVAEWLWECLYALGVRHITFAAYASLLGVEIIHVAHAHMDYRDHIGSVL